MYPMAPHSRRHAVLGRQPLKRRAGIGVLAGQEEVMVFVEQRPMKGAKGLPLLIAQFWHGSALALGLLRAVDFDTFGFHEEEALVDALDLGDELLLADGPRVRLEQHGVNGALDLVGARWSGLGMLRLVLTRTSPAHAC